MRILNYPWFKQVIFFYTDSFTGVADLNQPVRLGFISNHVFETIYVTINILNLRLTTYIVIGLALYC
jgi:hypothetical protein